MELEAWSGDWGLPSIDSECLKILAFAKFSGAPLTQVLLNQSNGDLKRVVFSLLMKLIVQSEVALA